VSFVIGTDGVMKGWNEGVLGMKPGGKRMLLVPPGMAYGARKVDSVIPENASLMFRIELIGLEDR
jgi:FKBP-type peptidyl-prolyl cis-trans isomerase